MHTPQPLLDHDAAKRPLFVPESKVQKFLCPPSWLLLATDCLRMRKVCQYIPVVVSKLKKFYIEFNIEFFCYIEKRQIRRHTNLKNFLSDL